MLLPRCTRKAFACCWLVGVLPGAVLAQGNYETNGTQYAIVSSLPGDQMRPRLALNPTGGFVVWEDNISDGLGLGISAQRLDSSFSPVFAPFRVNASAVNDQERPQVALLNNGGAAFVWQSGKQDFQHIYARLLSTNNTWLATNDLMVSTVTNRYQLSPALAVLTNGNVVVVYSSWNQQSSNSMQDVYAQILSPAGQKVGTEFLVNQTTGFNQRTPSVAALSSGGFVVTWVSEQQRSGNIDAQYSAAIVSPPAGSSNWIAQGTVNNPEVGFLFTPSGQASVDVFARLFSAAGAAVSGELLVNTNYDVCANPQVAAASDGTFMVVWGQRSASNPTYSWDIFGRPFSGTGVPSAAVCVNTRRYGDQFVPQVSALGTDYLVVWTSMGQDGSREGVFGQFLRGNGQPAGGEMLINTTTVNQQRQPGVTSDRNGRFVVAWTSFVGGGGSFDLFAQRYVNVAAPLLPMDAPFVYVPFVLSNGSYQAQVQVSWPFQAGLPIDHYEVFVDGAGSPAVSTDTNIWVMTGLARNSTHTFQVGYMTPDGRHSPRSGASMATTWTGISYSGIPADWMSMYWGDTWPPANAALGAGEPSPMQLFLTGANPLDPTTWLRTSLQRTPEGYYLSWNPQPGLIYQVQTSPNLTTWTNLGAPHFAVGTVDFAFVGANDTAYYRVLRLR